LEGRKVRKLRKQNIVLLLLRFLGDWKAECVGCR
jgi:hypothetical protein